MSGGRSAEDGVASPAAGPLAPAPVAVDFGVVAALGIEVGFLTDRLTRVRKYAGPRHTIIEGECAGKIVAVLVTGMGRDAARRGTQLLLDGHRPRWVLSAGFAGALDPDLKRNALVMPTEVLDLEGHTYAVEPMLPAEDPKPRFTTGRLLTVDGIVRTAAEKATLREKYGADLVDMETSAVAALCGERSVRFLSVRVVSDEAGVDLPAEIASLMTKSGSYRVGAALRAIWHRPSRLKEFWALHEHAQEAADRLAEFVAQLIGRLS
jgi:adenosylhomocysteine nucleosidase